MLVNTDSRGAISTAGTASRRMPVRSGQPPMIGNVVAGIVCAVLHGAAIRLYLYQRARRDANR